MSAVYVVGTLDTKRDELLYVRGVVEAHGVEAVLVDLGTSVHQSTADVGPAMVASHHPRARPPWCPRTVARQSRRWPLRSSRSSVRTSTGSPASWASADLVAPRSSRRECAPCRSGGRRSWSRRLLPATSPPMSGRRHRHDVFGHRCRRTEPHLAAGAGQRGQRGRRHGHPSGAGQLDDQAGDRPDDVRGDHAAASRSRSRRWPTIRLPGVPRHRYGRAVDGEAGRFRHVVGVLDITTTEVADLSSAASSRPAEDRFGAIARTGVPYVGSCGALDMVNFGGIDTVPQRFADRKFHVHNPQVTLMRTTAEENARDRALIGEQAQPVQRAGAFPDSRRRRLAARRAGTGVLRSGGRRGAVRRAGARTSSRPTAGGWSGCRTTSTTRSSPRRCRRRSTRLRRLNHDAPLRDRAARPLPRHDRAPASRSSAAAPAPGCPPSARRPAASTSS